MGNGFVRFLAVCACAAATMACAHAHAQIMFTERYGYSEPPAEVHVSCEGPACPDAQPPKTDLQRDVDTVIRENAELRGKVETLERKDVQQQLHIDAALEDKKYSTFAITGGPSFGQNGTALKLDASFQLLHAFYYVGTGGGAEIVAPLRFGRLLLNPIGLGMVFYQDKHAPLSVPWLARRYDFTIPISASLRVYDNWTVTATVAWFVPWINAIKAPAKEIIKAQTAKAKATPITVPDNESILADPKGAITDVKDQITGAISTQADATFTGVNELISHAYKESQLHPRVEVMVEYRF